MPRRPANHSSHASATVIVDFFAYWPAATSVVAAYPVGDPHHSEVRIVADRASIESPEDIYTCAYGANADRTDLHGGRNIDMISSLLGHHKDEIQLHRR